MNLRASSVVSAGIWLALLLIAAPMTSCGSSKQPHTLRLATTTSTENSGLLTAILPQFEATTGTTVEVVAVGTGQVLALGKTGDADVLLVHAPERENEFVAAGHGTSRHSVMYNDFIIVGPRHDPADIYGVSLAAEAMAAIAASGAPWASRGDDSGTHVKEHNLWLAAELQPLSEGWYHSLGQGMGATLNYANETDAYTLTDRGTYLAQSEHLPFLVLMVGGDNINANMDPLLYNPYGVIPVHPDKNDAINHHLALQFVDWLTSAETREHIYTFGIEQFGQQLFYPQEQPQ
jgi:tungstate transport system substrate-binding protein